MVYATAGLSLRTCNCLTAALPAAQRHSLVDVTQTQRMLEVRPVQAPTMRGSRLADHTFVLLVLSKQLQENVMLQGVGLELYAGATEYSVCGARRLYRVGGHMQASRPQTGSGKPYASLHTL